MNFKILSIKTNSPLLSFVRYGHRLRGKPPGVAKTLSQRLEELDRKDPELSRKNDIGFPFLRPSRSAQLKQRLEHLQMQRKDHDLEKLARNNKLEINLDDAKQDWMNTAGPFHIRTVADHYGVFEHLFGKYAFFTPRVGLDIAYKQGDTLIPVYYGNRLKPSDTQEAPEISFDHTFSIENEPSKNNLWTLVLTNPDGHLTEQNKEYVHWMIGNIPDGDLSKGELIVPYLQPFPPKGTGYHRHIFVLYKQDKKLDFSDLQVTESTNLTKRTFSTYEFYKCNQDFMTPAGLSFFQVSWDDSCTDFYHNVLNMKEPSYEYDFPEAYIRDQTHFPLRESFNLYLDRYRDVKEVNKEYLERKLAKTHPFHGPEPELRFPLAHYCGDKPSWLKTEIKKRRLKVGRINDVE